MDTWSQDPRKYLVMHLKLRGGVQFSNSAGKVETYLPEVLEPTEIESWQYRLMLELNGEEQFISAVKAVKDSMGNDFEANDVWTFLYWLIDKELLDKVDHPIADDADSNSDLATIPDKIVEAPRSNSWLKVPLQMIAILIICSIVMYTSYVSTPIVQNYFNEAKTGTSSDQLAEIKAARMPQFAETTEKEVSGFKPQTMEAFDDLPEPPTEEKYEAVAPSIAVDELNRLLTLRQELSACQIRRDEYYLLNDEDGYRNEVDRISELAKEIGQIRIDFDTSAEQTVIAEDVLETVIELGQPETNSVESPKVLQDTTNSQAEAAEPIIESEPAPALPPFENLPTVPEINFDIPEIKTDLNR